MKHGAEITIIGWLAGLQLLVAAGPTSSPALFNAIRDGDVKAIQQSIEEGREINARDDRGNTALHLAALNLDVDAMARILKAGANPNAKSLGAYPLPSRKMEFDKRIGRAKSWLKVAKAESPTELAFQLLGLGWAGEKPYSAGAFTDAILSAQKSDGGWPSLGNLGSDAWMTGLNLVALHEAGGVKASDPALPEGRGLPPPDTV